MTGYDDFDRMLAGWFEAEAQSPAPAGDLGRILDATRRRRPRPAWLAGPGSQWVGEAPDAGPGALSLPGLGLRWSRALILILVIAALIGGAILVGALLSQPSPLPTGRLGHLAYWREGDIFVADWDGTNPVRIADGPPDSAPPRDCQGFSGGAGRIWSPDGRHLAYRSGSAFCPSATVLIADPAGHVVASLPGTGYNLAWSPDSTRVATWVELSRTIGIYGLDGVRQALLTLPDGYSPGGDYDPVWSPDGRSLLIRLAPPRPSRVWELPSDGGTPRQVPLQDPLAHFDAVYSDDRSRMAFVPILESYSLVIAEADGTELRVLPGATNDGRYPYDGDVYASPAWSPTGDRVAFVWSHGMSFDQANDLLPNDYELRVVDVATGAMTPLASARGTAPLQVINFSPEGDRILFSRTDATNATSVWSVRVDGSGAQLLVTGVGWADWQWQPADR